MHTEFLLGNVKRRDHLNDTLEGVIKIYLKEVGFEGMDHIHLGRYSDQWYGSSYKLPLPIKGGNFLISCTTVNLPEKTLLHVVS